MFTFLISAILVGVAYATFRYSLLLPSINGIPILMYHKVSAYSERDFLTVPKDDFDRQLEWLKRNGFKTVSLQEWIDFIDGKIARNSLPAKPVVITFDDGYADNVKVALPILKKHGMKAAIFVTSSFIEAGESKRDPAYLNVKQLREWTAAQMEVALHSHSHSNFGNLSLDEISSDLYQNRSRLTEWSIPYLELLAYPFGARPNAPQDREKLKKLLKENSVQAAFRIGNRIHSWNEMDHGLDRYEVCRIDVRGDDPFFEFKIKLKKGRTKVF